MGTVPVQEEELVEQLLLERRESDSEEAETDSLVGEEFLAFCWRQFFFNKLKEIFTLF